MRPARSSSQFRGCHFGRGKRLRRVSRLGHFMYQEFFGLKCSPFQLSPDPFFMFSSERSKEALAAISGAIHQRKGFAVMTGEVGTGKTLVLRCLVESLERDE